MAIDTVEHWNTTLETLDVERLRELQLRKFRRVFSWSYERNRLYRRKYESAGIEPGDIRTWDDVARAPLLTKDDYRCQEKDPFPYGDTLCAPLEDVTEFHQTSGTTGTPVYQPDTCAYWEWFSESWATILWRRDFEQATASFCRSGTTSSLLSGRRITAARRLAARSCREGCSALPSG